MSDTGYAGAQGFAPALTIGGGNPEAIKYGKMWEHESYRRVSPGEHYADTFLRQARPNPGSSLIDFGCGTGRGGYRLAVLAGLNVTLLDFARNCLDQEVRDACESQSHVLRFMKADLEQPLTIAAEYGFCCDVMEHIPPDRVARVLDHILTSAQHVWFSISTVEDSCGALIGEPLHLSIHPFAWWLEQFVQRDCVIHWSRDCGETGLFYVSAWQDGRTMVDSGRLNETEERIKANVRENCAAGWQQVVPHEVNDMEVMIVGGGPSLSKFEEEITQQRADGVKLITLNGAYNWALDHGLIPSAQVIVDARAFNQRFTQPVVDGCKYLMASQVDPAVLDGLPKDRTYLWHTMIDLIGDIVREHYPVSYPIPSCTTVLNTSIILLRMLGFKRFHLYGCDSCLSDEAAHHAYPQAENDSGWIVPVTVTGGRIFKAHPWMVAQAQQFIDLIRFLGEEIELEVHGDGLLRHILDVGASIAELDMDASL